MKFQLIFSGTTNQVSKEVDNTIRAFKGLGIHTLGDAGKFDLALKNL